MSTPFAAVPDHALPAAPAPEPPDDSAGRGWRSWLPAAAYCVRVFLCVRVGLFVLGLLSTALLPANKGTDVPGWPAPVLTGGWHNVFTAWERYDALWYLRIAATGYRSDDGSAAFFPLYPLLVRAVSTPLGHHWLLGAYLVSNAALLVGLVLVHRLTELELGPLAARRTVLYLCVFPTGFFLFAPYSESLFLALSVGCLYAARRHRWAVAGLLGALASASRSAGLLLALPLVVEGALQAWRGPLQARWRGLAASVAAAAAVPVGMLLYLAYWGHYGQSWRRPLDIQKSGWSKQFSLPWHTLYRGWQEGTKYPGSYPGGYHALDLLCVLVVLAAGVWVVLRVRLTYSVYLALSLLLPLLLMFDGRPLLSLPRYYLVVVPVFWAFAAFAERWRAHDLVVGVSAAGAGLMSILYINWYFIF